ncbi:MAG: DUF72 domain-containing protein [Pseudomonadota bacterium]
MQIFTGTSGFSYPEWCGRFYPEALPGAQMLRFYASRLATVEINNTFYRMPNPDTVAAWRDEVPDSFCFAVKASRRITHQKKLIEVSEDVAHLFGVVDVLGQKLGPVLFQTPPFLKKDLAVLREFLACLPEGRRAAMEFRHPSWFSDDVYAALSQSNVALVGGDLEEAEKSPPLVATADFGYLRLRRLDYDPSGIAEWGERIAAQNWQSAYAYLKHEVLGPLFAEALRATLDGREQPDLSAIRASIAAPKPMSARGAASKSKKPEPKTSKAPAARTSKAPATSRVSKTPAARPSKAPSKSKKP